MTLLEACKRTLTERWERMATYDTRLDINIQYAASDCWICEWCDDHGVTCRNCVLKGNTVWEAGEAHRGCTYHWAQWRNAPCDSDARRAVSAMVDDIRAAIIQLEQESAELTNKEE